MNENKDKPSSIVGTIFCVITCIAVWIAIIEITRFVINNPPTKQNKIDKRITPPTSLSRQESKAPIEIGTCNKVMNAFNDAFNKGSLKLRAIKAKTKPSADKVFCTIYIQNNGDKTIYSIFGYIYYFDEEDISDKNTIYITTGIKPNETIKYDNILLPKNIKRAEIRNDYGDNIFEYDYNWSWTSSP